MSVNILFFPTQANFSQAPPTIHTRTLQASIIVLRLVKIPYLYPTHNNGKNNSSSLLCVPLNIYGGFLSLLPNFLVCVEGSCLLICFYLKIGIYTLPLQILPFGPLSLFMGFANLYTNIYGLLKISIPIYGLCTLYSQFSLSSWFMIPRITCSQTQTMVIHGNYHTKKYFLACSPYDNLIK